MKKYFNLMLAANLICDAERTRLQIWCDTKTQKTGRGLGPSHRRKKRQKGAAYRQPAGPGSTALQESKSSDLLRQPESNRWLPEIRGIINHR